VTGFDLRAGDIAGAETLEIMSAAPHYNRWQYDVIAPWIGRRVLEVGSGIGNMSEHIVAGGRERVVLTDIDEWYRQRLRERFAGRPEVMVDALTLPDPGAPARFGAQHLDTVIALNVVEHIEDDVGTLRTMGALVGSGGRVIILVPALQAIFGSLDEELGHFRRYSRASLAAAFAAAGLRMERMFWYNRVGVFGWWLNACVRRVKRIPLDQLRTFDRLVPLLRLERLCPLPFGQSLIAIGTPHAS
jgi:SAM-dependent methyltransferase